MVVGDYMKKNIYLWIILFLLLSALVSIVTINLSKKYEENGLTKVTLGEVTHSTFYAPLYVAMENGYFKEEGLDIDLVLISGANNVVASVLGGDVEIGFCGPEATIYVYNSGEKDYVVTFAGLTKRDGQFLVSREKIDNFDWNKLNGKEVLGGRIGGMPLLNFQNALKNANVHNVNINTSIDFASLSSAFISGTADFVNLFEPNASNLEKNGFGYVVASIGEKSGEMPYTAFNARKSYIDKNPQIIESFTKAITKGLEFVMKNDAKTIAESIKNQFPDTKLEDLTTYVERYKDADSWLSNPYIEEKLFQNLEDIIIDSGEINSYVPYNDLIQNAYKK